MGELLSVGQPNTNFVKIVSHLTSSVGKQGKLDIVDYITATESNTFFWQGRGAVAKYNLCAIYAIFV